MDGGLKKWRQERLQALADRIGSKAELGRQLGYRDGAFVGQMISGLRPITEKTVAEAESKVRGPNGESFKGWFSKDSVPVQATGSLFEEPTPEEMELLDNFRHMLDHDREELSAEIAMRAARAKADIDKYIQRMGLTPRVASASARAAAATVRAAVPPPQKELAIEDGKKRRRVGVK